MKAIKTIADGLSQPSDNFLLLRFIAAAMVIYGHAPAITSGGGPLDVFVWLNWGEYSGSIAVDLFFVISGFLITGSYLRRPHIADFLWARFIRIVPAYAVCLLFCALVLGAIFTDQSLVQYFGHRDPYTYVSKNLLFRQDLNVWTLPGVFSANKTQTINGSIWTLPAEVRMYAWAGLLGLIGVIARRWLFNIVIAGLLLYGFLYPTNIPLVPLNDYLRLAALFAAGAFCYVNRSWFPVHGALLVILAAIAYLCRSSAIYTYVFGACEVLFVFWFAYGLRWHGFNRFGDYSYGIYLWGYPSQQVIEALTPGLPNLANAVLGFLLALILGIASWYAIEKPALGFKGLPSMLIRKQQRSHHA